jgi:hypothetical protein
MRVGMRRWARLADAAVRYARRAVAGDAVAGVGSVGVAPNQGEFAADELADAA